MNIEVKWKGRNMKRLCISLDDETYKTIEELQKKTKTSKADVIRKVINNHNEQNRLFNNVDSETMMIYLDYLLSGEHVIIDVDLLCAMFDSLESCGKDFWEKVRESGEAHARQYYMKGMRTLKDILFYISKTNLFRLKEESPSYFTLILFSPSKCTRKFLKIFLEGVFKSQMINTQFTESIDKITVHIPGKNELSNQKYLNGFNNKIGIK